MKELGFEADEVAEAKKMGIKGIQVKTGKYRPGDETGADLIIDSVADPPEALQPGS